MNLKKFRENEPTNIQEIIKHPRFHHWGKGCNLELRLEQRTDGNLIPSLYCHDHQVVCSRSGWELHYWQGTNNRKSLENKKRPVPKNCPVCGKFNCQIHNKKDLI